MVTDFFSATYLPVIIAFITGVAGPVLLAILKHFLNVKKVREVQKRRTEFNTVIEIQQTVNTALNNFQVKYDLDRVWIAQFHNGGNFYPGNKSMKKLSVTFESTRPGISSDIMKLQNLPVSFFSSAFQEMNATQEVYTVDTTKATEDYAFINFWTSRGVQKSYLFPLLCLEGGFIGVFGVDYVVKDEKLSQHTFKELEHEASLLSGYVAALSLDRHN